MRRSPVLIASLSLVLVATLLALSGHLAGRAQDAPAPPNGLLLQSAPVRLPMAPAFVRLLRIRAAPGSGLPMHTHSGPEFFLIESGALSVTVNGPAWLTRASNGGAPTAPFQVASATEFVLYPGDQISFPTGTRLAYRNAGTAPAVVLAAVILPAGHNHPPGLLWIGGTPAPTALVGVNSVVLGDGLATTLPTGTALTAIERLTLPPGASIPASTGPVLVSVASGRLAFTVVKGEVQVSRSNGAGAQPDATPGTGFTLAPGDAAFFPRGMAEAPRSASGTSLVVLRLSVRPADATTLGGTPTGDGVGVIAVTTPSTSPTSPTSPTATAPRAIATVAPPAATEAAPKPSPTQAPAAGTRPPAATQTPAGSTVTVTEDGVRLRDSPSTDGAIVALLQKGQVLRITGPSTEKDGIVWWPVTDPASGASGYVAAQFLSIQR